MQCVSLLISRSDLSGCPRPRGALHPRSASRVDFRPAGLDAYLDLPPDLPSNGGKPWGSEGQRSARELLATTCIGSDKVQLVEDEDANSCSRETGE